VFARALLADLRLEWASGVTTKRPLPSPQAAQNETGKVHPQTRQIVHTVAIFEHEGLGVERVGRSEPEGFAIGDSLCLDCTLTFPLA
jgi:hypothetical protein